MLVFPRTSGFHSHRRVLRKATAIESLINTGKHTQKSAPDVFVIGAMRVGTTLLYDLLRKQEGICVASMKETDAYLTDANASKAASLNQRQYADPESVWVDISPNYTKRHAFPGVANRIKAANSDARFIYLVRNPIKRAQSHFQHVMLESVRSTKKSMSADGLDDVINTSRYYWQIEPYLAIFPIERFLFIDFEDFVRQPNRYTSIIREHIGAPDTFTLPESLDKPSNTILQIGQMPSWWAPLRKSTLGTKIREHLPRTAMNVLKKTVQSRHEVPELPVLSDETTEQLREAVQMDIPKFQKVTGLDLSKWKAPTPE